MFERLVEYGRLMRLDRPIGSLLLLWPTLWALWLAGDGRPPPHIVLIFVVGVFVTRAAGCVVNDYADRDFDPFVARTRSRPLAAGTVTPREALLLALGLGLVAGGLALALDPLALAYAVPGAAIAVVYPFVKRFTHLPQLVLGVAFSWGVPMAFAAIQGATPVEAWILFAANLAWVMAYDTLYAMADRPDDLKVGVKSTAILFGRADRLAVAASHVVALALLGWLGTRLGLGGYFAAGVGVAAAFAVYHQILCRDRDPDLCFAAFLNNTWLGAAVMMGIVLATLG